MPGPGSGRMDSTTCPTCGAEELATVLVEDSDGTRRLRSYCKQCERRRAEHERDELRPLASGLARLLVFGGVLLAVLAATSDYLATPSSAAARLRVAPDVGLGAGLSRDRDGLDARDGVSLAACGALPDGPFDRSRLAPHRARAGARLAFAPCVRDRDGPAVHRGLLAPRSLPGGRTSRTPPPLRSSLSPLTGSNQSRVSAARRTACGSLAGASACSCPRD